MNKIYLKDYQKHPFRVDKVHLYIRIEDTYCLVESYLDLITTSESVTTCILNGENLTPVLIEILPHMPDFNLDHEILVESLAPKSIQASIQEVGDTLQIEANQNFVLHSIVKIFPDNNFSLEGLYRSGEILCTQCEAEGFRKISYFIDRPDTMSLFTVKITADKRKYPVLLSNGNCLAEFESSNFKHSVVYQDPFRKPSYLFALVAGDLMCCKDSFTTKSGKNVSIRFYVEKKDRDKTQFAINSLKKAMRWDEERFNLEYDLDIYNVVAVDTFNAGAMENKSLNIFNSVYVLADETTATDADYFNIESVIAHEYFHNWTGNRVTCRDWFQLTLKEGLTVYRDQEFSADLNDPILVRIWQVKNLKEKQFPEDAGPNKHPIRPQSYSEINNFYTATVYEKGAEVIRMIEKAIGKTAFKKGMEIYFTHFDGQAVTTEDFLWAMEKAGAVDLSNFKNWYDQSGIVTCDIQLNKLNNQYRLEINQRLDSGKKAYPIPFHFSNLRNNQVEKRLLQNQHEIIELNVEESPILSLFQNFSAPVKWHYDESFQDLLFRLEHDSNQFNTYQAGQDIFVYIISKFLQNDFVIHTQLQTILFKWKEILYDESLSNALKAEFFKIPSLQQLADQLNCYDFSAIETQLIHLEQELAKLFDSDFKALYQDCKEINRSHYSFENMGLRSIWHQSLYYLCKTDAETYLLTHYKHAKTMTEIMAVLKIASDIKNDESVAIFSDFRQKWKDNQLVMNKWFAVQAGGRSYSDLNHIQTLESDALFDPKNPNKVRALYGSFSNNLVRFHQASAYEFIADKIKKIDTYNPMLASALAKAYKAYPLLDLPHKESMHRSIEKLLRMKISNELNEVLSNTIKES